MEKSREQLVAEAKVKVKQLNSDIVNSMKEALNDKDADDIKKLAAVMYLLASGNEETYNKITGLFDEQIMDYLYETRND